MTILHCPDCGGTHYGSFKCPFLKPCAICGEETVFACSDCAINSAGEKTVHICKKADCRDSHEADHHPAEAETKP